MKSDCLRHFGWKDFDRTRPNKKPPQCPVEGCSAKLVSYRDLNRRDRTFPWCLEHGIRLHSGTFVYWNGDGLENKSRLRNFIVRPDLVCAIALAKGKKVEAHRLGNEMSEDALSWNVFVSLAAAGKLREAAQLLTGQALHSEPSLYLWGNYVDLLHGDLAVYPALLRVRDELEQDIPIKTEPDIMLIVPDEMVICIEAKFGSDSPLAEKPTEREALLAHYFGPSKYAKRFILPGRIGERFHSQLFRNIVFACEMARELRWHVVSIVSSTQLGHADPTADVCCYLDPHHQHCFTYRTWEDLHARLIRDHTDLEKLDDYLHGKSAHYCRAFELD